jgi:Golgi phosphoprotein 3 (GPP34)
MVAGRTAPEEGLAGHVLGLLADERERHPLREWLLFVARTAADDVASRLERAGYLRRAGGRWRGRRWVPVDADSAFAPLLRVRAALDSSRPLTAHNAVWPGWSPRAGWGSGLRSTPRPGPAAASSKRWHNSTPGCGS